MNKRLWSGGFVAIALLSAVGVTAQTPSPSPSRAGANLLTVRGCIRRTVDIHLQSESSLALSDPDTATQFVLIRIPTKAEAQAGSAGSTPRGTAATPRASIYRLDDTSAIRVSPHVGHEVEISGTLIDEERHDSTGIRSNVTSPKLAVTSIKMLATSCPNEP